MVIFCTSYVLAAALLYFLLLRGADEE